MASVVKTWAQDSGQTSNFHICQPELILTAFNGKFPSMIKKMIRKISMSTRLTSTNAYLHNCSHPVILRPGMRPSSEPHAGANRTTQEKRGDTVTGWPGPSRLHYDFIQWLQDLPIPLTAMFVGISSRPVCILQELWDSWIAQHCCHPLSLRGAP